MSKNKPQKPVKPPQIHQMPKQRPGPQGRPMPPQPPPTEIQLAKQNLMNTMNTVGNLASQFLNADARYMGVNVITEDTVDHAIEVAQMFSFKMNGIVKEEMDRIDEEMAEPGNKEETPEKGDAVN